MFAVWLVAYSHGQRRSSDRTRLVLPACILQTCQQAGINELTDADSDPVIIGLAQCSPGVCHGGPLTPWNREEQLLHPYWNGQACYSVRIHDFWELRQPTACACNLNNLRLYNPAARVYAPDALVVHDAWNDHSVAGTFEVRASQVLERWGVDAGVSLPLIPVVRPLAELVSRNLWRSILLPRSMNVHRRSIRVRRKYSAFGVDWPPQDWLQDPGAHDIVPSPLDASNLLAWADKLRQWAPLIGREEPLDTTEVAEIVASLEAAARDKSSHTVRARGSRRETHGR